MQSGVDFISLYKSFEDVLHSTTCQKYPSDGVQVHDLGILFLTSGLERQMTFCSLCRMLSRHPLEARSLYFLAQSQQLKRLPKCLEMLTLLLLCTTAP